MLKKFLRNVFCCAVTVGMVAGYSGTVYANVESNVSDLAKSFIELNEIAVGSEELHTVEDSGRLYNVDKSGNKIIGWSYDKNGDLYYSDSSGELIRNKRNEYGLYFDESGKLHSKHLDNVEGYKDMARRFEKGNKVKFSEMEDLLDFFEYYSLNYKLLNYSCEYTVYRDDEDGKSYAELDKNENYNREELRHKILDKFGTLDEGLSDYDKLLEVSRKITSNMIYDSAYINTDLDKALEDGKGVCWHYSKIAKVLLDEAGVKNEVMIGFMDGQAHMWVRCLIDDKWAYLDPTLVKSMWWSYSNIPYTTFIENYKPIRNVQIAS